MDAERFGRFVADCRKEKGITQAELAEALHVTDKAVSRWERGIGFPDISTLEPLAGALGVSILELMKSERIAADDLTKLEAAEIVSDALRTVGPREDLSRCAALRLLARVFGAVLLLFLALVLVAGLTLDAVLMARAAGNAQLSFWAEVFALFRCWVLLPAAGLGIGLWMRRKHRALLAANEPLHWWIIAALLAGLFLLLSVFQSSFAGNVYGTVMWRLGAYTERRYPLAVVMWDELATTRLLWCGFIAEAAVFLPMRKRQKNKQ